MRQSCLVFSESQAIPFPNLQYSQHLIVPNGNTTGEGGGCQKMRDELSQLFLNIARDGGGGGRIGVLGMGQFTFNACKVTHACIYL